MSTLQNISRDTFGCFDLLGHPVWAFSPHSQKILVSNSAATDWLEYGAGDLEAFTIRDIRPRRDWARLAARLKAFAETGVGADSWTILTRSGKEKQAWFEWREIEFEGRPAVLATILDTTRLEEAGREKTQLETAVVDISEKADLAVDAFRRLFESAPGKMVVLTPETYRIVAATDEYVAASMTERPALYGQDLFEAFPEDPEEPDARGADNVRASLARVEAMKLPDVMAVQRYSIRNPEGVYETRHWLAINKPVFGPGGDLLYIIHRTEDVTDLVRHQKADQRGLPDSPSQYFDVLLRLEDLRHAMTRLQEQDARLRSATRLLRLGSWEYDRARDRLSASPRALEIFGLPTGGGPPDFEGYITLVHPDDRAAMRATCVSFARSTAAPVLFEHRVVHPDGHTLHVRGVGERHSGSDGDLIVGFVQDISEGVRDRRQLEEATHLIRVAGESVHLGGWRVDIPSESVFWSEGTYRIHQIPPGSPLNLTECLNHFVPEHRERMTFAFRQCVQSGTSFDEVCELITSEKERIWVRTLGWCVLGPEGIVQAVQGAIQNITDLRRAEERADEADRKRGEILESISDAFFTLDSHWRFVSLNSVAEALIQRSRVELVGDSLWQAFPDLVGTVFEQEYTRCLEQQVTVRFREYYPALEKWFDVTAYPSEDGMAVYFRDVTSERARAEQVRLLGDAVQRMNDIVIITRADPVTGPAGPEIVFVNTAFERITGYAQSKVIGQTPRFLQGEKTDAEELARIRRALETRQPVRAELINYSLDGRELHLELDIVPLADESGHYTHFVSVERDITQRKLAQETQRLSDERFRLVSRATNDVVWDWDIVAGTIWWNEAMEEVFGYLPGQLPPGEESWTANLHHEDRDRILAEVYGALEGDEERWTGEYRFHRADGSIAMIVDRGFILRDDAGRAVRMIGSVLDLTERRDLERKLRESQKLEAVGQLTGGIAHDFNNLLTVILGNAEELSDRLTGDPDMWIMADMTAKAAERGAELTHRLLAFARRQALQPKRTDLNVQIKGMEALFRRTLSADIEIELLCEAGLWLVDIDPGQLEVALLNLAVNARDAMPRGGRLRIETCNVLINEHGPYHHAQMAPGEYVSILVTDTGMGMDADTAAQAFEPFFTTKEVGKGSGLGLSMVFGFVSQSSGHVKISSVPGEGTSVQIYFPRCQSVYPPGPEYVKKASFVGGSETILVVEDDQLVCEHLSAQLLSLGYQILTAGSGPDALEIVNRTPHIDLLLTDIVMPGGLNGRQVADLARQLRPSLKVLFTSGYSENAIVHEGRLDPDVDLLSKPYRKADLAAILRKVLNA